MLLSAFRASFNSKLLSLKSSAALFLLCAATSLLLARVPAPRPPPHCSHHHGGSPGLDIDRLVSAQLDVLTATCPDSTFVSCTGVDRGGWTAAARSRACCHSLHPAGGWSSFRIEAFDAEGRRKRHGGDTWAVTLTHGATGSAVRARVLDEGNGTYLVAYVPHLPGAYQISAWLYYSACHGYRDMPPDTNFTEKQALRGGSGELAWAAGDSCFIGTHADLGKVEVPPQVVAAAAPGGRPAASPGGAGCGGQPAAGQRGRGAAAAAVNAVWAPAHRVQQHAYWNASRVEFVPLAPGEEPAWRAPAEHRRLLIFGDSTFYYSYVMLSLATEPWEESSLIKIWHADGLPDPLPPPLPLEECQLMTVVDALQKICRNAAQLPAFLGCLAPRHAGGAARIRTSSGFLENLPLEESYSRDPDTLHVHYEAVFKTPTAEGVQNRLLAHVRANDTLIINIGMHFVKLSSFEVWRQVVDALAPMLRALPTPHVYWRTCVNVVEHSLRHASTDMGTRQDRRFVTEARRLKFDLYAERVMRAHGVRVIDIDGLPAWYVDDVHFSVRGYDVHNQALANVLC